MKKLFILFIIAAFIFTSGCTALPFVAKQINEAQNTATPKPKEEKYVEIKDGKELVHAYCASFDDESFDVTAMFDELTEQKGARFVETNVSQPYYPCKEYLFVIKDKSTDEEYPESEYAAYVYEYESGVEASDVYERQLKHPGEEYHLLGWECFRGVLLRINNFVISGFCCSGYDDAFYPLLPENIKSGITTVAFDLDTSVISLNKSKGKSSPEKKTELFKSFFEGEGASVVLGFDDVYTDVFMDGHMVGRCFIHEDGCDKEIVEDIARELFAISDRGVVYLYHDDGFICMVLPEYAEAIENALRDNSEA